MGDTVSGEIIDDLVGPMGRSAQGVPPDVSGVPHVPLNLGDREGGAGVYFVAEAGIRPPVGGGAPRRGDVCWGGRPGGHGPAR